MAHAAQSVSGISLSSKGHLGAPSVRASQNKCLRISTKRSTSRVVIKAQSAKDRNVSAQAAETIAAPSDSEGKSVLDSLREGFVSHYKKAAKEYGPDDGFKRMPVRMRIHDQWYNASGWAAAHPGGARWIQWFDGRDATGVFYAFHSYGPNGSSLALDRLAKLPKCSAPPLEEQRLPLPKDMDTNVTFQELRVKLEEEGFFKRNMLKEFSALAQVVALFVVGTAIAHAHPIAATIMLSLGGQQAGWLAHDYIHGRGKWCAAMRWFGAVFNGHSAEWWTQKHSLHHTFTNEEKHDNDILMEPFFFLRPPSESGRPDSKNRKFQHIYGYPLLAIMYILWRSLSLLTAIKRRDMYELSLMSINYAWMAFCLPPAVALGHVILGGFLVASLVSATHQSEEVMAEGDEPDFVTGQFRSTRDADTVFGPVETWLWGGMDTQLEHHLFPTIPRYNYHKLRPILKAWAEKHNVDYRISPSTTIIADNWKLLNKVAHAP